jgi:hypothetical protein
VEADIAKEKLVAKIAEKILSGEISDAAVRDILDEPQEAVTIV